MSIFFSRLLNLIWSERCMGCERCPENTRHGFCAECQKELVPCYNTGDSVWHIFKYQGPVQKALCDFKYRRKKSYGRKLAGLAFQFIREQSFPEFDLIMPVPLHWRKEWGRGFNQVTLLGLHLGKLCGKPLGTRNLVKRINTPSQTELNEQERKENVYGSFHVRKPGLVEGKRVLLLDDVYTTGATTSEAARMLKRSGARRVIILTIAKS